MPNEKDVADNELMDDLNDLLSDEPKTPASPTEDPRNSILNVLKKTARKFVLKNVKTSPNNWDTILMRNSETLTWKILCSIKV